jgi:hypothetical protein
MEKAPVSPVQRYQREFIKTDIVFLLGLAAKTSPSILTNQFPG